MVDQFAAVGVRRASALDLTGTGDLGAQILESVPAAVPRRLSSRSSPQIVQAIHEAFAIAIASTFWVSIAAAILAAVLVLFLRDIPVANADAGEAPPAEA